MGKVIFRRGKLIAAGSEELRLLKKELRRCPDGKARICLHDGIGNALQEMLIIHGRGAYVRPHKHVGKDESISVIEGRGLLVIFDPKGRVKRRLALDACRKKGNFIYRIRRGIWHSIVVLSGSLIFHEVSAGPFRGKKEHVYPGWAPGDGEPGEAARFTKRISSGGDGS